MRGEGDPVEIEGAPSRRGEVAPEEQVLVAAGIFEDDIAPVERIENVAVVVGAAGKEIVALTADEPIRVGIGDERIVTAETVERVLKVRTRDDVGMLTAFDA